MMLSDRGGKYPDQMGLGISVSVDLTASDADDDHRHAEIRKSSKRRKAEQPPARLDQARARARTSVFDH
jgi:hypothetical protein